MLNYTTETWESNRKEIPAIKKALEAFSNKGFDVGPTSVGTQKDRQLIVDILTGVGVTGKTITDIPNELVIFAFEVEDWNGNKEAVIELGKILQDIEVDYKLAPKILQELIESFPSGSWK